MPQAIKTYEIGRHSWLLAFVSFRYSLQVPRLFPLGQTIFALWVRRVNGAEIWPEHSDEEENFCPCRESNKFSDPLASSLFNVQTELTPVTNALCLAYRHTGGTRLCLTVQNCHYRSRAYYSYNPFFHQLDDGKSFPYRCIKVGVSYWGLWWS
jgi:hypothetical protein